MGRPFRFPPTPVLLGLLLVVATAVRLLFWNDQAIVTVDGTSYIRLARMFTGGARYLTAQPPGYPALIVPFLALLDGDGVVAARLVALIAGVLAIIPLFLLGRRWLGTPLAFTLGAILALTPLAIRYSIVTMSEAPYLLFALLTLLAAAGRRDRLTGALGGIAFQIRPEGMILTAMLALATVKSPRRAITIVTIFVLVGLVPALAYNRVTAGEWTVTRKGVNLTSDTPVRNESIEGRAANAGAGTIAPPTLPERLRRFGGDAISVWPGRLIAELRHLGTSLGWAALLLAAIGVVLAFRRRVGAGSEAGEPSPSLMAAGLVQLLAVPLFAGVAPVPRLVLPLLPFVAFFALFALGAIAKVRGARLAAIPALLLFLNWGFAAAGEGKSLKLQEDGYYPELVRAGRELKRIAAPNSLVMDRKPYTAFYAGARYEQVPFGGYHAMLDAAIAGGADYLVVDEAVAEIFRPDLLPLVRDSFVIRNEPRLSPVWFDPTLQGRHTLVYRVIRAGGPPPPGDDPANAIRRAVAPIPHSPRLHSLHAEILWLAGRRDEALREYAASDSAGTMRELDRRNVVRLEGEIDSLAAAGRRAATEGR